MGVEFSCPTLIRLPMPALPVPWNVEGWAAAAVTGSAESNGAARPAAASLSVSRRVKGGFIEHSPMLRTLAVPFLLKHHGISHGSRAPRSAESSTEALESGLVDPMGVAGCWPRNSIHAVLAQG